MMRDDTTPICPIPHLGYCIRERCNFWDEEAEQCTGDCFGHYDPLEPGSPGHLDNPCVIPFCEDLD
jgi:hypothetical protein